MSAMLRNLPPIDEVFGAELGGVPRDPLKAELLDQFWPECFEDSQGRVVMADADAMRLEALFAMFGVPLPVHENSLATLGHAYDVFVLGLERFVTRKLRYPDRDLSHYLRDWPLAWVRYIEAVARGDAVGARVLAVELQPLSPDCVFPPGVATYKREA